MTPADYKRLHPSKPCVFSRPSQWSNGCIAMLGYDVCGVHATPEQRAERHRQKLDSDAAKAAERRRLDQAQVLMEGNARRTRRLHSVDRLLELVVMMVGTPTPGPLINGEQIWVSRDPDWSLGALAEAIHEDLGWDLGLARERLADVFADTWPPRSSRWDA
jgi:hypothetical protein